MYIKDTPTGASLQMQNRVDLETQPKLQQCHQRRGNQQRTEQILKKNESAEALPFFLLSAVLRIFCNKHFLQ